MAPSDSRSITIEKLMIGSHPFSFASQRLRNAASTLTTALLALWIAGRRLVGASHPPRSEIPKLGAPSSTLSAAARRHRGASCPTRTTGAAPGLAAALTPQPRLALRCTSIGSYPRRGAALGWAEAWLLLVVAECTAAPCFPRVSSSLWPLLRANRPKPARRRAWMRPPTLGSTRVSTSPCPQRRTATTPTAARGRPSRTPLRIRPPTPLQIRRPMHRRTVAARRRTRSTLPLIRRRMMPRRWRHARTAGRIADPAIRAIGLHASMESGHVPTRGSRSRSSAANAGRPRCGEHVVLGRTPVLARPPSARPQPMQQRGSTEPGSSAAPSGSPYLSDLTPPCGDD